METNSAEKKTGLSTAPIEIGLLVIAGILAFLIPFTIRYEYLIIAVSLSLLGILAINKSPEEFIKNSMSICAAYGFGYVGLNMLKFSIPMPF